MGDNKGYIKKADNRGSVNISEEVIAIIAASAAAEVSGVYGLSTAPGREITQKLGRRGSAKGVKISVEDEDVVIDIQIMVEMGTPINEVGSEIQNVVKSAVETAVGLTVKAVNVHVCGIALKKN